MPVPTSRMRPLLFSMNLASPRLGHRDSRETKCASRALHLKGPAQEEEKARKRETAPSAQLSTTKSAMAGNSRAVKENHAIRRTEGASGESKEDHNSEYTEKDPRGEALHSIHAPPPTWLSLWRRAG